ncbi:tripartite motif-containing protein 40-like [Iris pallida]|uniref:Tripartite motif-containing protein 40-like n=1 Tax=Iris pallida TaxID=29817 RepID=A0AAX6HGF9_IRIPA|nr:tripartite motif-containing protein 40-like [Iris pallida]
MASTSGRKDHDPCPICLEPITQEAYLDQCYHAFCYPCIFYWSQVLTKRQSQVLSSIKCPLCKTDNLSIVHGFNGEFFQRHYISKCPGKSWFSGAHEFRLQWNGNDVKISKGLFDVHKFWKRRRYLQENVWIERWLRREIQVLTQEEDVDIIVHHLCGVMETFKKKQAESMKEETPEEKRKEFSRLLLDAAKPFVLRQAERFVGEVELFLASGLNIEAYDKVCMQHLAGMSAAEE